MNQQNILEVGWHFEKIIKKLILKLVNNQNFISKTSFTHSFRLVVQIIQELTSLLLI